ncbi:type IV pilin protein [Dyella jejuensis]|uniref:Type IV pilin protein n=1 Tax=Dyella jejuensis TaxID=1432009 RepID=A0ABW8JH47_9GAMM
MTKLRESVLRQKNRWPDARGFTLIELMVVVAIIAILTAIALPIYQQQVMRSRRTAAKSALFDVASREERYYSTTNNYATEFSTLGYSTVTNNTLSVPGNGQNFYTIQFSPASSSSTYTVQAVPVAGGPQANDQCGTYSLTDLGVQTNPGASQQSGCW